MSSATSKAKQMLPHLNRVGTAEYMRRMSSEFTGAEFQDFAPLRYWALRCLTLAGFDYSMGVVIVVNMIVMIIDIDRSAIEDGASSFPHWTEVFGWLVLLVFVLELLLRLYGFRSAFFKDPWNVFDFVIVITDALFSVLGLIVGDTFPVSILRIFRLTKLARVSKVLRVFPELRLLLAGLLSSISAIFWGTLLLCFCLLVWSMVAVLFIHPLNQSIEYDGCDRCPRAYSSVMQATLTFFQQVVTGDSWGQATIPLIEKYPSTVFFFIPVFLSIGMAVMNLILGVVVSVAEQAKDEIKTEETAERYLFKLEKETHLFELCRQMDTDHTGELTREQIYAVLDDPGEFRESVAALDIAREDFDIAWTIMDTDGSGKISYKEFVRNLCKMRSSDTEFMLAYIKCYITEIRNTVLKVMKNQHEESMGIEQRVEREIAELERKETDILEEEKMILALEFQPDTPDIDRSGICQSERISKVSKEAKIQGPVASHIDPGGKNMHSSSKCTDSSAPILNIFDSLPSFSSDAGHCRVRTIGVDETQAWFKSVCDEIGTTRLELKDILFDISRKLGPPELHVPPMQQESMIVASRPSLLVVPDSKPNCLSLCCKQPSSGRLIVDTVSASPHSDTASLLLPKGPPSVSVQKQDS